MAWCYLVKWQNCYLYYVILRIWSRLILQKFLTPSDVVGSPFHSLQHESPKIIKLVSTTPGILRMQNLVNSSTIGLVCVWEREGERGYCWVHCTMFQPTLCLSSLNELVEKLARSQQSKVKWDCWRSLSEREEIGSSFPQLCTKVKPHKWLCDVKLVRHVGRKKEKKEAKGKGGSAKEELKKRKWLKQSQDKWLVFNVSWCEECEREKRRKGGRNK